MKIKKYGKKSKKFQTLQRYFCKNCQKTFTLQQPKNKTYPISIILNAISNYNLGNTQSEIQNLISRKFKLKPSQKTISNWLNEYKAICTFSRLRKQAIKLYNYNPTNIIHKQTLSHIQPYTFKCHKAKLDILLKENPNFAAIKDYVEKVNSKQFPHHIFTYNKQKNSPLIAGESANNFMDKSTNFFADNRASQIKFNHLNIKILDKNNQSNELAKLALNLAKTNKERHQAIQDFMLINDSTTIAVEVPVYLTNWDAGYYRNQKEFIFPLSNYTTPITGHIDILQIRNGLIHILDYKPEANKTNPIEQLTIYALALSRKLNLPLYYFKSAWFDENNYFEFFPLHAVYKLKKKKVD